MRKHLILTSLLTLTGCMGGGSADGLLSLFGNESKPAFGGTPQETIKANSSITKMETVTDTTTRIKEIYEESGLNYTDNDVKNADESGMLPGIYYPDDRTLSEQYRNMSDEDKKTLRKAQLGFKKILVLRDYMNGYITDFTQSDLEEATKMLNAFYKIESNGRIEQKFNIDNLPNVTNISGLQDFFYDNVGGGNFLHLDKIARAYIDSDGELWGSDRYVWVDSVNGGDIRLDYDGKIMRMYYYGGSGGLLERQGNSNEFKDLCGNKVTLETFGDGKLSYSDFGYMTYENEEGYKTINTFAIRASFDTPWIDSADSMYYINNHIMNFKGTAVGLFVNNPDGDPNELAHTTKMRTDNATLHINNGYNWSTTLTMPFSEDGWYDVKMTEGYNGSYYANTTFSNYHGDTNDVKKQVPSTYVDYASIGRAERGEYALENPTEVAGRAYVDFGDQNVRFEAAYGMKAVE